MTVHEYPRSHGSLSGLSDTDHHLQYARDEQGTRVDRPLPGRRGRYYWATDEGNLYRDNGTSWESVVALPPTTKTIRIPHTWAISGDVKPSVGDTDYILPFFVPVPAGQTVRVKGVRHRINSGTSATVRLSVEAPDGLSSVAVTPFGDLSVTTTRTTNDYDAPVANDEALVLEVTGASGAPKNMTFTVYLDYVV